MARRVWIRRLGLAAILGWAVVALWMGDRPLVAAPEMQAPILAPGDVATPTATYEVILWPTPTPAAGTPMPGPAAEVSGDTVPVYVVQPGDTLWTVALEMGVDLDEAPCLVAPTFRPDQPLVIGDKLEGLPLGWRCHRVQAGETPASIARQAAIDPEQLRAVAWNALNATGSDDPLTADTYLRVPGSAPAAATGFMAFMLEQPVTVSPFTAYAIGGPRREAEGPQVPDDWPFGSGRFTWPVYGWLSQGYRADHPAVDIAAPFGALVTAADRGVVIRAGWNEQGYGNFVVIDHNIDYVSLYSHLTDILVAEGEIVAQGQVIGTVGSTGNSTGAHLHFEIRDFGRRTNPLEVLLR